MKRWARHFDQCITCGTTTRRHHARGQCKNCLRRSIYCRRPRPKVWALLYDCCIECGNANSRHRGFGLCARCYLASRRTNKPRTPRVVKHRDCWSNKWSACVNCGGSDQPHKAKGLCATCYEYQRVRGVPRPMDTLHETFIDALRKSASMRKKRSIVLIDRVPSGQYAVKTRRADIWNSEGTEPVDFLSPLARVRLHEMRGKVLAALFIATSFLTPNDPDRGLMFISNLQPPAQPVTAQHVPGGFLEGIVEVALR